MMTEHPASASRSRSAVLVGLGSLGVRDGDVLTLRGADGDRHIELAAMRNNIAQAAEPRVAVALG